MSDREHLTYLLEWLTKNDQSQLSFELTRVEFRTDSVKGLSCFAKVDFNQGDIIFSIPRKCIICYNNSKHSELPNFVTKLCLDHEVKTVLTSEFIIFLHMIDNMFDRESFYGPYLRSLEYENVSSILNWPDHFKECLNGTNLGSSIKKVEENLNNKLLFIEKLIVRYTDLDNSSKTPQTEKLVMTLQKINKHVLTWAWFHYLSRRYPGEFGYENNNVLPSSPNNNTNNNNMIVSSMSSLPSSYGKNINSNYSFLDVLHGREADLENLGCLVPLLDILNHDTSQDWLKFNITTNELQVICNHPVKKVFSTIICHSIIFSFIDSLLIMSYIFSHYNIFFNIN